MCLSRPPEDNSSGMWVSPVIPMTSKSSFQYQDRSMIAKMPGDRKVHMGNHLELVCLLQAAEIERLCEFLDDYKLK